MSKALTEVRFLPPAVNGNSFLVTVFHYLPGWLHFKEIGPRSFIKIFLSQRADKRHISFKNQIILPK